MKVYKFGGASLSNLERIKNVGSILREENDELLVVVSAMGKTTNALEKVANAYFSGNREEALSLFNIIKQSHITTAKYLLVKMYNATVELLSGFFTEIEWLLHDNPVRNFDYYYDQIVCIGELLSSALLSAYLTETNVVNTWLDVRDVMRTDDRFRDAQVDYEVTETKMRGAVDFDAAKLYITQGFIGCTNENESTTLGREGSDYSAAVFANLLNAAHLTIWKDVQGVMNADPKQFNDTILLPELSYAEVAEMSYYGAQVIHPKTVKPLQNKNISLLVKSFLEPTLPGTVISKKNVKDLPPIKVVKNDQVLLHLRTHDFSFIGESPMVFLYNLFESLRLKPNLIQTGAIDVQICVDDNAYKIDELAVAASGIFDVQLQKGLTLLTIRHYTRDDDNLLLKYKQVLLLQQTTETVHYLYR